MAFISTPMIQTSSGGGGGAASDHGSLTGLTDDDHSQYVHLTSARTIETVHTFNPGSATPWLLLGANATGQLITGLNADEIDGLSSAAFATASHTHAAADTTSGTFAVARLPVLVGDSGAGGTAGIAPAPGAGDAAADKYLKADGTWATVSAGSGDMAAATYDPATIAEQLVGLTATQTLTNKTLTQPALTLTQSATPTPTAEGVIEWDTDGNQIKVGDGAATLVFSDDTAHATAAQGATADSALQDLTGSPYSELSDVTITAIASGEIAKWSGSAWINNTLAEAGISATGHAHATSDVTSGTFADARISESSVTQHQAAMLTLAENVPIIVDPALSADGKYSGITEAGTAGATLAFGDVVYLAAADSRWELADASAAATSGSVKVGICVLAAAADGNATTVLLYGNVRADAAFPTFTISAPVYISETAGDTVVAQPTTTDAVIRVLGFANTANELFFCPSPDYITHT